MLPYPHKSKKTFIYALCDPDTLEIRYIGKANKPKKRYGEHLEEESGSAKTIWLNNLKSQDKRPILQIIEEGKGMFLYKAVMELRYPPLPENSKWKAGFFGVSEFIIMKTSDEKLIPWLASQTDILAEDYTIID